MTSTYFEGQALPNKQAKRGYSRDKRPDCKQVVVGLVLDRDGFPKAHEVSDGNVQDRSTVDKMLDALEKRTGKKAEGTVIVDRGMAYDENLEQIRKRGLHYLVAGRQPERNEWLDELEREDDWEEVIRTPSPRNPFQKKTRVEVKLRQKGDEVYILCRSEGRKEKDRAIRETHEGKLLGDLRTLEERVAKGRLKAEARINKQFWSENRGSWASGALHPPARRSRQCAQAIFARTLSPERPSCHASDHGTYSGGWRSARAHRRLPGD